MIIGVGTDIIEIERIRKACEREAFLLRYFTIKERKAFSESSSKLAGCFAVKEAVSKIFGTGFSELSPIEIEVLRRENGQPFVNTYGRAEEIRKKLKIGRIHVSISNTQETVIAYAIGEGEA